MDGVSRALLAVIAAALCVVAAGQAGWIGPGASDSDPSALIAGGRYRLVPVAPARKILLLDVETGRSWHTDLRMPTRWKEVEMEAAGEDAAEEPGEP